MKTVLKERVLWYDGESTITDENIIALLKAGKDISNIFVEENTPKIKQYNSLVSKEEQIQVKKKHNISSTFDKSWNIPESYKTMNIDEYVNDLLQNELSSVIVKFDDNEVKTRKNRVLEELKLFKNNELYDVLRTIIYVINTFREKNVIWGCGRGSSVSSYVLYLIGVHDIDSVQYDLDFSEFMH